VKAALQMIVFVLIVATVLTGALLGVESFTRPIITKNEELKIKRSVLGALGIPHEPATVETSFETNVRSVPHGGRTFYATAERAVAFEVIGPGLWGPIRGVLAVEPDGATVRGLTIVHQEETPGLGSRIAEPAYLEALRAKQLLPALTIAEAGREAGVNEVDGITGATLSCQAFVRMLNSEAAACLPALEELDL
jgi:Na+-transporting NADH:ubiquinone oxidoreductase subunit C